MRYFLNIKLLFLICGVLSFGLLTSCDDEDESTPNNGQVALLSFGPTGAKHGEQIQFIGLNLDKVEAIDLPGVTVAKAQFVNQSSELITLVVPEEATAGRVTLKTPAGDVISKTVLSFEVPVTITSVTPEARPGANITVTGSKLNWVEGVIFGDSQDTVTTFVNKTLTELTLTVPADAKSGILTFITGGTEPLVIQTENELIVTLPAVTAINPTPVARGANLTITGTNLDLTMGVLFKGVNDTITEFVSKTADQLVVKVPAEASKGAITLMAYSGVTVESQQLIQIAGDLPPLAPLAYALFDEGRSTGWDDWGWGGASVWNSNDRAREGDIAAKKTYDGSGDAIRMHNNTALDLGDYKELTFSVYGTAGTGGKNMKLITNEAWGSPHTFAIVEGEWTTYTLKLADLGNPTELKDLLFQADGWAGVVYYDHIGLR
jgi:hypothetical protein